MATSQLYLTLQPVGGLHSVCVYSSSLLPPPAVSQHWCHFSQSCSPRCWWLLGDGGLVLVLALSQVKAGIVWGCCTVFGKGSWTSLCWRCYSQWYWSSVMGGGRLLNNLNYPTGFCYCSIGACCSACWVFSAFLQENVLLIMQVDNLIMIRLRSLEMLRLLILRWFQPALDTKDLLRNLT